jgi:hypothetical protein
MRLVDNDVLHQRLSRRARRCDGRNFFAIPDGPGNRLLAIKLWGEEAPRLVRLLFGIQASIGLSSVKLQYGTVAISVRGFPYALFTPRLIDRLHGLAFGHTVVGYIEFGHEVIEVCLIVFFECPL